MEEEIKDLLERNIALTEENNRLLRNMRTANRVAFIWRVIYLAFFIGSAYVAFTYFKPYLTQITDAYGSVMNVQAQLKDATKMPR